MHVGISISPTFATQKGGFMNVQLDSGLITTEFLLSAPEAVQWAALLSRKAHEADAEFRAQKRKAKAAR
jgi:predicted kinase